MKRKKCHFLRHQTFKNNGTASRISSKVIKDLMTSKQLLGKKSHCNLNDTIKEIRIFVFPDNTKLMVKVLSCQEKSICDLWHCYGKLELNIMWFFLVSSFVEIMISNVLYTMLVAVTKHFSDMNNLLKFFEWTLFEFFFQLQPCYIITL